ncbi:MAG: peptidylprolyl isomerase [Betaproteobacteria bacterium]|nr:peptidylprolyl isomerase [Betaproteobacteria bacterium]
MKLRLYLGVLLVCAIPAVALAQPKAVTVNGKSIPYSRVDLLVKQQVARGAQDNAQLRQAAIEQLINNEVVIQEADRKGLTKSADVQGQLDLARRQVIFQAYLQNHFKANPIKEEAARAEYERAKSQSGDKEYKAHHILVEKEAEAKAIIDQIKKGGKFEDLAKQSKDIGTKDKGGDLDWSVPANYTKPFADALVKLEKGKTTDAPVQSQFGWHVIRLDDVRPMQFPAFDSVKQRIYGALQEQEIQRLVKELRAKAKVE